MRTMRSVLVFAAALALVAVFAWPANGTATGFTVTPKMGATIVTALQLTTANDSPERDPASYLVEGSSDGTTFTTIASGTVTW